MAKSHRLSFVVLLSTQDKHMKLLYGALEFPGTHHFPRVSHRERDTKGTCTTNCTLLQPQNDSNGIKTVWILTSEN